MQEQEEREIGTVKWYNPQRGFGFIGRDAGGEDVMVQYDHINIKGFRTLEEGQRVSFVVRPGRMGLTAVAVSPLEPEAPASAESPTPTPTSES